jgi:hypothetical protein
LPPLPEATPIQVALPLTTNNDAELFSLIALSKISNNMNINLLLMDNGENHQQD